MVSGKLATRRAQIVAECMNYPAVVNRGRAIPWQPKSVYRNSLARLPAAHRHLSSLFLPCLTHFSSARVSLPHAIGVAWQCMTVSLPLPLSLSCLKEGDLPATALILPHSDLS